MVGISYSLIESEECRCPDLVFRLVGSCSPFSIGSLIEILQGIHRANLYPKMGVCVSTSAVAAEYTSLHNIPGSDHHASVVSKTSTSPRKANAAIAVSSQVQPSAASKSVDDEVVTAKDESASGTVEEQSNHDTGCHGGAHGTTTSRALPLIISESRTAVDPAPPPNPSAPRTSAMADVRGADGFGGGAGSTAVRDSEMINGNARLVVVPWAPP